MFEIKITNLETGEEKATLQVDGMLLLAMNKDIDKTDTVSFLNASIDEVSNAMACNDRVRSACRLAIAKWDAMKDKEQSESLEALGNIIDALKKAGL